MKLSWLCFSTFVLCWYRGQAEDAEFQRSNVDLGVDPPGHMKPLGSHRPVEGPIESIDYIPDPKTFYENYVKPGKPLLMKGQARKIPAFNLWSDDYLSKNFGEMIVDVELGKKENRSDEMINIKLKTFLKYYKKKNVYLVQDLSDHMKRDFHLLRCLLCGGFTRVLQTAVMWFSSGGTKSVFHNDNIDNINCIFEGSKDFYFVDKKYKKEIEEHHFIHEKGYSQVDVDKVDMNKFPNFRDLPWYTARMEKGDCFFIPLNWYHHVHSFGDVSRNLAINIWFTHLYTFNDTDCKEKGELPETQSLADFEMVNKVEMQRSNFLEIFVGLEEVPYEKFMVLVKKELPEYADEEGAYDEMFGLVDANKDYVLSWEELQWFDIMEANTIFPGLFADDDEEEEEDAVGGGHNEADPGQAGGSRDKKEEL